MLQFLRNAFNPGSTGWKIDPRLPLAGLAGVAALLALAVVIWLWRDDGAMRPLYGAGQAFPAGQVMEILDAENIRYRLHPQSGQVLVHEQQLSRARLLLAAKGVQVAVPAGYDLFDQEEPLGTSQFVQNVRLKRSLEGELARTIMALDGVDAARVHLALAQSNSFVISARQPAKASVMLQLRPGQSLQAEQVTAIVNLVASSVPGLVAADVSVVDQSGSLLSQGLDPASGGASGWRIVDNYQRQAAANVEAVLVPLFGPGNFRVSVAADIDFSQKEETLQHFGDTPRLRNERLQDESVLDKLAIGVPGSLSNRPAQPPAATPTGDQAATSLRKESSRQMDYDQGVTHVKHPPFALRQQSVAVLLNVPPSDPDAPGPWTPEAQAQLEQLVRSAVGFNAARGDLLTVSLFPFVELADLESPAAWWHDNRLYGLARLGVVALISLLVLWWVVRPVVRRLAQRESQAEAMPDALPGELQSAPGLGSPARPQADDPLAEISLPAPGSGVELQLEHLQMLAGRDPERVSEVLKQWIGRHDSHAS